jgi:hypothetical protein
MMHRFIDTELATQVSPPVEVSLSRMHFNNVAYMIVTGLITCQRGSARQCCKSHSPFKGKSSFLTPANPKTIHQKETKIGMVDYVHEFYNASSFKSPS